MASILSPVLLTGASSRSTLPNLGPCLLLTSFTGDSVPGRWSGAEGSSLTPCPIAGYPGRLFPRVGIMKTSNSVVQHRQLGPQW